MSEYFKVWKGVHFFTLWTGTGVNLKEACIQQIFIFQYKSYALKSKYQINVITFSRLE